MKKFKHLFASLLAVFTVFAALVLYAPTELKAQQDSIAPKQATSFGVRADRQMPGLCARDVQTINFGNCQAITAPGVTTLFRDTPTLENAFTGNVGFDIFQNRDFQNTNQFDLTFDGNKRFLFDWSFSSEWRFSKDYGNKQITGSFAVQWNKNKSSPNKHNY